MPESSSAIPQSADRLRIGLSDGASLSAELFLPDGADRHPGAGQHPGVVVLHESFGLNDDIRRIAARFAAAGYAALAPDLYSHGTRIVCLARVMGDMTSGSGARELADILAAREALAPRPQADPARSALS